MESDNSMNLFEEVFETFCDRLPRPQRFFHYLNLASDAVKIIALIHLLYWIFIVVDSLVILFKAAPPKSDPNSSKFGIELIVTLIFSLIGLINAICLFMIASQDSYREPKTVRGWLAFDFFSILFYLPWQIWRLASGWPKTWPFIVVEVFFYALRVYFWLCINGFRWQLAQDELTRASAVAAPSPRVVVSSSPSTDVFDAHFHQTTHRQSSRDGSKEGSQPKTPPHTPPADGPALQKLFLNSKY